MDQQKPTLDQRWQLMIAQAMGHELTNDECVELTQLMLHPTLVKAMATVLLRCDTMKNQLLAMNFGNEEHRAMASKLQGQIVGINEAYNLLLSFCQEKEETK